MAEVEIRYRNRVLERFSSEVDPEDEIACVALLRQRARALRRQPSELHLRAWLTLRRRPREYRAA